MIHSRSVGAARHLKQRRELQAGSVSYVNQPVVEAALHGRLLVLEGLEKAERNLLPILNNLLENREMALEDGAFLMHPERFDALVADGMSESELARRRLLRVSPDFMVVALGLQEPRFPGAPLDPPLRSRFQGLFVGGARRFIDAPSLDQLLTERWPGVIDVLVGSSLVMSA